MSKKVLADLQSCLNSAHWELRTVRTEDENGNIKVAHSQWITPCIVGWDWETDILNYKDLQFACMLVHYELLIVPPSRPPTLVPVYVLVEKYRFPGYRSSQNLPCCGINPPERKGSTIPTELELVLGQLFKSLVV